MLIHFILPLILILAFILSIYASFYPNSKEFIINEYLKLRLEQRRTIIYVNNHPFRQCMYLLLNIPVNRIEEYDEIKSIDEAALKLNRKMERNHNIIPPETEFWGHCSNLQAWTDNDYDTRLLHRNLAFPLLKALSDAGDPVAKRKFKEEIAMRFATGHPTVITYLTQNGYLHYLTEEEFESMLMDLDYPSIDEFTRKILTHLKVGINSDSIKEVKVLNSKFLKNYRFSYKYLMLIKAMEKVPKNLRQSFVEIICNQFKNIRSFPMLKFLDRAQINFEDLNLKTVTYNEKLIGILTNKRLNLCNKIIEDIFKINKLEDLANDLIDLDLSNNRITEIKGLDKLVNLKKLNLKNNYIKRIEGIYQLKNLEYLDLSGNIDIKEIPETLNELSSLKTIKLTGCRISTYSDLTSRFFWMGQNYRYYTKYTREDVEYYEKTHKSKAGINERLYKNFVKWLFKMRSLKKEFKFTYIDIEKFEKNNVTKAISSGKPTKSFLMFLDDKKQLRITSFLGIS